jgi:hypothetical protein
MYIHHHPFPGIRNALGESSVPAMKPRVSCTGVAGGRADPRSATPPYESKFRAAKAPVPPLTAEYVIIDPLGSEKPRKRSAQSVLGRAGFTSSISRQVHSRPRRATTTIRGQSEVACRPVSASRTARTEKPA